MKNDYDFYSYNSFSKKQNGTKKYYYIFKKLEKPKEDCLLLTQKEVEVLYMALMYSRPTFISRLADGGRWYIPDDVLTTMDSLKKRLLDMLPDKK